MNSLPIKDSASRFVPQLGVGKDPYLLFKAEFAKMYIHDDDLHKMKITAGADTPAAGTIVTLQKGRPKTQDE